MKQTKFFWARYKSQKAFDLNKENLNNLNDWFVVQKTTSVSGIYYQSTKGNIYWCDYDGNLSDIELSNMEIQRPYTDEELQHLYAQEDELQKLFNIL